MSFSFVLERAIGDWDFVRVRVVDTSASELG